MDILEFSEIIEQVVELHRNGFVHVLFWCVLFNSLTEILIMYKTKKKLSVDLFALAKHVLVLLFMVILNVYLPLFGFEFYAQGITSWMIFTYSISLTENWSHLGLPLPETFKELLIRLKNTNERNLYFEEKKTKDRKE